MVFEIQYISISEEYCDLILIWDNIGKIDFYNKIILMHLYKENIDKI